MKFLIVIHYCAPHIGGMETVVAKQAQSLVELGHSVTIVTCRPNKAAGLNEVQKNGVIIKRFRSLNFVENVFGVTFPIISPHHLIWFLRNVNRYDIVHIHDVFYMSSWLAGIACSIRGKTYFLTQHVGIVEHPSRLVLFIEKGVYTMLGNRLLRKARKVVAYNDNVVKFLKSRNVRKDAIIQNYNGIDTGCFSPVTSKEKKAIRKKYGLKKNEPIVLFVGRLVPKKGFQILLDGASSKYTYILAGYGIVPQHYKGLANVIFFGPASQDQLRDLYRLSDVFVFPSIGEIFTLVHQEALASGLPVIVANDPGYKRYMIDRSHMILAKRTPKAIAVAVDTVIGNKTLARQMSGYSRRLAVERFSWANNYPKEYSIYELGEPRI